MSECYGCTKRYAGCKGICPVGVAEEIENIEKRERRVVAEAHKRYYSDHITRIQSKSWLYTLDRERTNKIRKGIHIH